MSWETQNKQLRKESIGNRAKQEEECKVRVSLNGKGTIYVTVKERVQN